MFKCVRKANHGLSPWRAWPSAHKDGTILSFLLHPSMDHPTAGHEVCKGVRLYLFLTLGFADKALLFSKFPSTKQINKGSYPHAMEQHSNEYTKVPHTTRTKLLCLTLSGRSQTLGEPWTDMGLRNLQDPGNLLLLIHVPAVYRSMRDTRWQLGRSWSVCHLLLRWKGDQAQPF